MEALVLYDYVAQESNELNLKKGDIITKIKAMDGGWWEGTSNRDGKRGYFPDNYVKVIHPYNPKANIASNLFLRR